MELINGSGVRPVEYKVLLLTDHIEKTTGGGLYIPDTIRDKEQRERVVATLVDAGGRAFKDPDWGEPCPKVGDRVRIAKYAGYFFTGSDGKVYQLANDKDIAGIVVEQLPVEYTDSDLPDNAGDGKYAHLRSN